MSAQVVVTGLGVVSAAGVGVAPFRRALIRGDGALALHALSSEPITRWPMGVVGGIEGDVDGLGRIDALLKAAASEALEGAGWGDVPPDRRGLVVGTTCGGVHAVEALAAAELAGEAPSPDLLERLAFDAPIQRLAQAIGAEGPAWAVTVACASGSLAVGMGARLIQAGHADVVLAGGGDTVSSFILKGFAALRAMGRLPFAVMEAGARGVVLGEGAAFLLLESRAHAKARGAAALATVLGSGSANDGFAISRPDPAGGGLARAIAAALKDAGCGPEDVDHLNLHATGTPGGDRAEAAALGAVFGARLPDIPAAAVKALVGHTSGAAGAVEAAACVLSLSEGFMPAAPPALWGAATGGIDLVRGAARRLRPHVALSLGAGFGGSDAALVLGRSEGDQRLARALADDAVWITGLGRASPQEAAPPGDSQGGLSASLAFWRLSGFIPSKESRRLDDFCGVIALAAGRALADSGLSVGGKTSSLGHEAGLVVGSAFSCTASMRAFAKGLGGRRVNPVTFQNTVSNAALGYAAMLLSLRGPSVMIASGLLSGACAVGYGAELVKAGRCGAVVAGGGDWLCAWVEALLAARGGLPGGRKPVSGGAFVVLESPRQARARGAVPYARLSDWSLGPVASGASTGPPLASQGPHPLGAVGPWDVITALRSGLPLAPVKVSDWGGGRHAWLGLSPPH